MATQNAFDNFEGEAYRETGNLGVYNPENKWKIPPDAKKAADTYMEQHIESAISKNPEIESDPRAKRFRAGSQTARDAAALQEKEDRGRINLWDDFGGAKKSSSKPLNRWNEATPEEENQSSGDNRQTDYEEDEELDEDLEDNTSSDDITPEEGQDDRTKADRDGNKPQSENEEEAKGAGPEPAKVNNVPGIGDSGSSVAKTAKAGAKTAASTGTDMATAGAGAETAGLVAAEAGFAAPELVLAILALFGFCLIMVFVFTAFNTKYPDSANAEEQVGSGTSVICLDPGHPSEKGGAPGETELNFKIATELKPLLEKEGYVVIMTKTTVNEKVLNDERAKRCGDAGAAIMYRIHADGSAYSAGYPYHIMPNPDMTNIYTKSKEYSETIQSNLIKTLKNDGKYTGSPFKAGENSVITEKDRGVSSGTGIPGVLDASIAANKLKVPTTLIETIQLAGDGSSWLDDSSNRSSFVKGLSVGISSAVPKGGGNAQAIVDKACQLIGDANRSLYESIMVKTFTDCFGFVATVLKNSVDPAVVYGSSAANAPRNYFETVPAKYTVIRNVTNTSSLVPGDLLFDEGPGSHASIYVGSGGCGCSGNAVSASLNDHGPRCSNWYSDMSTIVRLK